MCGRFLLTVEGKSLKEYYGVEAVPPGYRPGYNISPGQAIAVITGAEKRRLTLMRWGYLPRWARDTRRVVINARAEGIDRKPFFRDSFRRRRCLIPADGFYEWQGMGKGKQPMCIRLPGGRPFALAGIWDCRAEAGREVATCCIITTAASASLQEVHDRMPALLAGRKEQDTWLDPGVPPELIREMLRPYSGVLEIYPVPRRVNSPEFNTPECLKRAAAPQQGES